MGNSAVLENYRPAKLLRLPFTERDLYRGKPLYEAIFDKCLELKMAGAAVFKGLEGFGDTAEIHRSHILGNDLPVVEEMMDKGILADRAPQRLFPQQTSSAV